MISSEILERELPDVASPDLVPLNLVVDAVIQDVYQRLVELGEVLPSLHESARAAQIFQFSLYSRRQVVKLLALVRWSKESEVVAKCMVSSSLCLVARFWWVAGGARAYKSTRWVETPEHQRFLDEAEQAVRRGYRAAHRPENRSRWNEVSLSLSRFGL